MGPQTLPIRPEDMFCHAVYTASHAINRAYAPLLKDLALTYPQYITLAFLWDCDKQKVSELAQKLAVETSTMTPLVKRLEALGLATRTKDKKDGRQVLVVLTKAGRALHSKAPNVTACMIERTHLSDQELTDLQALLQKLRFGLTQQDCAKRAAESSRPIP